MIGVVLSLATALSAQTQPEQPWTMCKDFDHFVELVDREGAAYQTKAGAVVFLDDSAKETKRMTPPSGSKALYWSEREGLVCAPRAVFASVDDTGRTTASYPLRADMFAQGYHVFARMNGIVYLGPCHPLACGLSYPGPYAAVDADGRIIATITRQMRPALLYTYRGGLECWDQSSRVVSPEIAGVGLCAPGPRGDLRMVGKKVVVYIGQFVGPGVDDAKYKEFLARLPDLRAFPLDKEPPSHRDPTHEGLPKRKTDCFLFATDIGNGLTKGLALFTDWEYGESSESELGLMTLSSDERFLFVVAQDKILRFAIKEMLKKAGLL